MFFWKRPNSEKLLSFSLRTATQEQLQQTTTHIAGWSQVVARPCLPFLEPLAWTTDQKNKNQSGFNKSWKVSKEKQEMCKSNCWPLSHWILRICIYFLTARLVIASQVHVMGIFFFLVCSKNFFYDFPVLLHLQLHAIIVSLLLSHKSCVSKRISRETSYRIMHTLYLTLQRTSKHLFIF